MSLTGESVTAIQQAVSDVTGDPIVTRYVIVAETIDEDGAPALVSLTSPGLPLWVASGMLRWQADTMGGQPGWTHDEDEGDA